MGTTFILFFVNKAFLNPKFHTMADKQETYLKYLLLVKEVVQLLQHQQTHPR